MNKKFIVDVLTSIKFLMGDVERVLREAGENHCADQLEEAYWILTDIRENINYE